MSKPGAGRIVRGELNYPGIGSTEHGQPPEGFPCVVTRPTSATARHCTGGWPRES